MLFLQGSLIFDGLLLLAVGLPLIFNKIPRNRWYGVRLAASYKSEEAWYRINHFGGVALAIGGVGLMLAGVLCLLLHVRSMWLPTVMLGGFVVVPCMFIVIYAMRRDG
jgi:uncharacterized membrane protein